MTPDQELVMPDIQTLIQYIDERQIKEGGGSGYSLLMLLSSSRLDIMTAYMVLEILVAINARGHSFSVPHATRDEIRQFLKRCTTREGYVANPTSSSVTLDSIYAGYRIARYIGVSDPLGIGGLIDSLQNENGGFKRTPFGGISTLESCYLALSIILDDAIAGEGIANSANEFVPGHNPGGYSFKES